MLEFIYQNFGIPDYNKDLLTVYRSDDEKFLEQKAEEERVSTGRYLACNYYQTHVL